MPTCQQTMSVTVSGPLTMGPTVSPSATSSHQRGSAPRGRSARVLRLDLGDLVVGVGGQLDVVVLLPLARLGALGTDHQPVLGRQQRAVLDPEDLAGPLVDRPLGELARLVEHADEGVAAPDRGRPAAAGPTTRGRWPSRRRGRPRSGSPFMRSRCSAVHLGDLVLADEGVAADEGGRGDRPAPAGLGAVGRIAPEGVVVAVGLGDVAEHVGGRHRVVRAAGGAARARRCGPAGARPPRR